MSKYNWQLQKGSKHTLCPNCRRKTFKLYVSVKDGKTLAGENYGRCERINSCSYLMYPPSDESQYEQWVQPDPQPIETIEPDFIPRGTVESTFKNFEQNIFMQFLRKTFGSDKAIELQSDYNIGTAKGNGTIFWQQDKEGRFRTGKVMYYGQDGRRLKNKNSWYLHKRVNPDFELQQVFFGEHLVSDEKPIALCESEKTAILMSMFKPDMTWLAAGGSQMLNIQRLSRLPRVDYVYADQGCFNLWERAVKSIFPNAKMDMRVEKAYMNGIIESGDDILDLEMIERSL